MKDTLSSALLVLIALLPVTGIADEDRPSDATPAASSAVTHTLDYSFAESKYAPRWRLLQQPAAAAYFEDWSNPMSEIHFRDASTMARVTRMRKLSLLTLARTDQGRLFLGVNEKGILGFHFSALALRGNDDYVELARMPYLTSVEEGAAESDVD